MFNNSTSLGLGSRVRISEGLGLTLVLFISLVLNLSVCFIIWTTKPLLAKPSNILVGNLCIANLLLTACGIPFSLVTIIKDQHDAYSHSILCQVWRNWKKIHYFHSIKEIWKATVGESSIFFQSVVVDTRSLISHFFLKTINSQLWVSALVVSMGKVQTSKIHCKKRLHNRITSGLFVCLFFFLESCPKALFC